jgi:hypothetical protein
MTAARADCRAMASPDKREDVVMLYKIFLGQRDGKSLIPSEIYGFSISISVPIIL